MSDIEKKSVCSIPVMFQKLDEISNDDVRFTRVRIWLMHLGLNENACDFSKEVVDEAIPTLGYIPIVGYIDKNKLNEKDFSDHKYILTKDENGIKRKYVGHAYGVVLSNEDNNAHYEERLCDDGINRTFLVVDGLIWNQFEDSSEILNRDLIKSHSMELVDTDDTNYLDGYEDENCVFHFTKITFRGACILGKDCEPAMLNSTIEVQFTVTDFANELQKELTDKLTTFTKLVNNKNNKGGKDMPNLDDTTDKKTGDEKTTDFSQTVNQLMADISNILAEHGTFVDRWGDNRTRFSLVDIQENEVIVMDRKENYTTYGFPYTTEGDKPVIDFSNGKRKKITYADYEESDIQTNDGRFDFVKEIEDIASTFSKKNEEIENKLNTAISEKETIVSDFEKLKTDYEVIKPKYEDFCKKEQASIEEAVKAEKNTMFAKFDNYLSEVPEYIALKDKAEEMSVSDIETQCSVLYTKKQLATTDFSKRTNVSPTLDIVDDDVENEGYVSTIYGNIPVGSKK